MKIYKVTIYDNDIGKMLSWHPNSEMAKRHFQANKTNDAEATGPQGMDHGRPGDPVPA